MLELTIPGEDLERIPPLVEDIRVAQMWTSESTDTTGLVRILLDAADTEAVSDVLIQHLGSRDKFRLVSFPVEATVPAVEEPPKTEPAIEEELQSAKKGPRRISREELYEDLAEVSKLTPVYVVLVALSAIVAAVGLIRGDVAIIIGAMVIAPLLGPNVSLSLACTLGDPELAKRSLKVLGVGVVTAAVASFLMGKLIEVDPNAPELAARTHPGIGDIIIALAAGTAGALAFTRGVPGVVVGVMVAVALLPPLVAAGLLAGSGHGASAAGALRLLLTNVTCVNLAAVATFLLQKVGPRTWWEADRAKKATRLAVITWILMLVVLLVLMRPV
jgi:uncharacterized hydrophobic protein (TIGR00341 family)